MSSSIVSILRLIILRHVLRCINNVSFLNVPFLFECMFLIASPFFHLSMSVSDFTSPAAGSNFVSIRSITFTDIAFPICFPSCASDVTKLNSPGISPCSRSISVLLSLLPRLLTQCPRPLHVRHGTRSDQHLVRSGLESQSMMYGSRNGLRPLAVNAWRNPATF